MPQRMTAITHRLLCSGSKGSNQDAGGAQRARLKRMDQNVVIMQQGTEMHELPIIVKRCGQCDEILMSASQDKANGDGTKGFKFDTTTQNACHEAGDTLFDPMSFETDEILALLDKCSSAQTILRAIGDLLDEKLESEIIQFALLKLLECESTATLAALEAANPSYSHLVKLFCKKCDNKALMDALLTLRWMPLLSESIDAIGTELAHRSSDSCLTIVEICETIDRLVQCKCFWIAEKFWASLADQEEAINADNIKFVFEALPKLKGSRRAVVKILDRVMERAFPLMQPDAVCDILLSLERAENGHTKLINQTITCWLHTNIHSLSERQLETIVHCLNALPFSDAHVEASLERYMKAKAARIQSQTLMAEIARHTALFRLRNPIVLNVCADFFIANIDQIEPANVRSLLRPFGLTHFQPVNAMAFWAAFERYLDKHFYSIPPADVVDVLLEAILLEMFPRNHLDRVFTRNFMHTLHSVVPIVRLASVRQRLQLIDSAMTLEMQSYEGPILPRNTSQPIRLDSRIRCLLSDNEDIVESIAGDKTLTMTIFKELPHHSLYVIDLLLHPPGMGTLLKFHSFDSKLDYNGFTAVLVHVPEHYDSRQKHLIGAQQMRIRHLRRLGLNVVSLNYERMHKLSTYKAELHKYFIGQMKNALPPLKPE